MVFFWRLACTLLRIPHANSVYLYCVLHKYQNTDIYHIVLYVYACICTNMLIVLKTHVHTNLLQKVLTSESKKGNPKN